jgi:hypothetical protein
MFKMSIMPSTSGSNSLKILDPEDRDINSLKIICFGIGFSNFQTTTINKVLQAIMLHIM